MLEPLFEQLDDVMVVEGVVDVLAVAARFDQAGAAQQPQLMRDRGLGQIEHLGEVADRDLGLRQGVEDSHARGIAEHLEGLGQGVQLRI